MVNLSKDLDRREGVRMTAMDLCLGVEERRLKRYRRILTRDVSRMEMRRY